MSAKILLPNQCMPLHFIYGREDCCLCRAKIEIEELKAEMQKLSDKLNAKVKDANKTTWFLCLRMD